MVQDTIASNEQGQPLQQHGRQEPVMEECIIPQSPPHLKGPPNPGMGGGPQRDQLPEDLHPPQDGVGNPMLPEVGDCNQEGQLLLAPISIQANRDALCQDQLAQQTLQ